MKNHLKSFNLYFIVRNIIFLLIFMTWAAEAESQNFFSSKDSAGNKINHNIDIGVGVGLDYGGIFGMKVAVIPYQFISIFAAGGLQLTGPAWNVGTTLHLRPENDRYIFRPNLKIMYGVNGCTKVFGISKYDKLFYGFTPGVGFEFMFGRKKTNGFDIDVNIPIREQAFYDQVERMQKDPTITPVIDPIPFAVSVGYHYEY